MTVLDEVVFAFLPARIAGHPAVGAQRIEPILTAGDDLVNICLVPYIPIDPVHGAVEDPVDGQRQFDDS